MKIINISLCIILIMILTGCSKSNNLETDVVSTSSNSYSALLFVNGKERKSVGKTLEDYQVKSAKLIGTVATKYDIEISPKQELTSNYLEEGTEIYSIEGDSNMFLAKKQNGEYEVFQ